MGCRSALSHLLAINLHSPHACWFDLWVSLRILSAPKVLNLVPPSTHFPHSSSQKSPWSSSSVVFTLHRFTLTTVHALTFTSLFALATRGRARYKIHRLKSMWGCPCLIFSRPHAKETSPFRFASLFLFKIQMIYVLTKSRGLKVKSMLKDEYFCRFTSIQSSEKDNTKESKRF